MRWLFFVSSLILMACSSNPGSTNPPGPTTTPWESVTQTFKDSGVIVEKVTYRSGTLKVFGQVCRPNDTAKHPILMINHGGFSGLAQEWGGNLGCKEYARNGYVVLESSYRGEDGSDGQIEVCQGEVDDVLAMLEIGRSQTYAKPDRAAMVGFSHGGCISVRAVQRGAKVQALIDFFGPTDWIALYQHFKANPVIGTDNTAITANLVLSLAEKLTGGPPEQFPGPYLERSPVHHAQALTNFPGKVLIVQGSEDDLVPPAQSCALAVAVGGFSAHHVVGGVLSSSQPKGCIGTSLTWSTLDPRSVWNGQRFFLMYQGLGHEFAQDMLVDANNFISRVFPPL